jgi:HlyD family secretion protein
LGVECWALLLLAGCGRAPESETPEAAVIRGPLTVWTSFDGTLESRAVETIVSRVQGRATLVDLAPEGVSVRRGEVLARFDDSSLAADAVRLENELARAAADLDALENAEIPLARSDLAGEIAEARRQLDNEQAMLVESRDLSARKLIPGREVEQGQRRVDALRTRLDHLEQRRELLDKHAHPAKLARARADLSAAHVSLAQVRLQLTNCVIRAPVGGMVVYLPLYTGNEYRPVRVGDAVFPNQPFLALPDLSNLVVQVYVPESDLARVQPGLQARIQPLAYPERLLAGAVESLGPAAQARPGHPAWQHYVRATVRLDEGDARLRPGMSLRVDLLTYRQDSAVLVPRAAVRWEAGESVCQVRTRTGAERRRVTVGPGNAQWLEALDGLKPGERVILP